MTFCRHSLLAPSCVRWNHASQVGVKERHSLVGMTKTASLVSARITVTAEIVATTAESVITNSGETAITNNGETVTITDALTALIGATSADLPSRTEAKETEQSHN